MTDSNKEAVPEHRKVRAIDVLPFEWGVWCSIAGGKPFVNTIESRKWSDDGKSIWFMLGTHNFLSATPDEEMDLVPETPPAYAPAGDHAAFLAKRPRTTSCCPTCGGKGRVNDE